MNDRSERHIMHPWLARQRTQKLELPPDAEAPFGVARLALEAAVVAVSTSEAHQARAAVHARAVVVKRKRTLATPAVVGLMDASCSAHDAQAGAAAEGERSPRVFRVDSAPKRPEPENS